VDIKICGMTDPANIAEVIKFPVDFLGFIFHKPSPRYVGHLSPKVLKIIPERILKTGVFVDSGLDFVLEKAELYGLDAIQLHGGETPAFCEAVSDSGYLVIKAFPVGGREDLCNCGRYEGFCDYFLFDTKTSFPGGSGKKFDRSVLFPYDFRVPYFLSGGIGEEDFVGDGLKRFGDDNPFFFGVDLNSRFEKSAGIKDLEKLKAVFSLL
jgi:phosphoribosylanthranilate isomerase